VTWHDGRPFTSDDVLFTFDEIMKSNARSDKRLNLGPIDSYDAPDPQTFVIHLSSPHTSLTTPLADLGILPRHVFDGGSFDDDAVFDTNPIGTGPFRFVSRDSDEVVFEANEAYFRGAPRISRLVVRPITNDDTRADAVLSGTIDIAQVTPNHVALLSQSPSLEIHRFRTGVWRSMVMNVSRPILQDARVRRAISLGLDREAMVEQGLNGMGQAAYWAVPPANWAYPHDAPTSGRDIEKAAALLDEAGWKTGADGKRSSDGQPLELTIISLQDEIFRRTAGDIAKKNLEEIGFVVELNKVDRETYGQLGSDLGPDNDALIAGWSALTDPGDNLTKKYRSDGSQNGMGYSNPELDEILDRAASEPDRDKAKQIYREALEIIAKEASNIPLAYPEYVFVTRNNVTGIGDFVLDNFYEFTRFAYLFGKE
jgi:peptide/nickel transport system substrate-binding protein